MVDHTKNKIQRQLANGDFIWVNVPDDYRGDMQPANVPIGPQIAGQNACTHCGQIFATPGTLQVHITAYHLLASGQADMRGVEMPDGSSVPVSSVPEMLTEAKQQKQEAIEVLEQNEQLKKRVGELEALLAESMATSAPPGQKTRAWRGGSR